MSNRVRCPGCEKTRLVPGNPDKLDVTCSRCGITYSADRKGDRTLDKPKSKKKRKR